MIDRRQFFRRFCGAAVSVALAPVDAFRLPELDPFRGEIYGRSIMECLEPIQQDINQELNGILHEMHTYSTVANVRRHTPMLKAFEGQSAYRMDGERLVFGIDLKYPVQ